MRGEIMALEGSILYALYAILAGTLFAIVYSLRVLVLMERRIAKIEIHIENLTSHVLSEEITIEKDETAIKKSIRKKNARK